MLVARNNCSASMARASKCGQVAGPNDSSRSALSSNRLVMAVGGADQNRASRLPVSRQPSSFLANSIEVSALPRSSSTTLIVVGGGFRMSAAAIGKFGDLGRPADALQIAFGQLGLGRPADLPASDDVEQHGAPRRPGGCRLGRRLVAERPHAL